MDIYVVLGRFVMSLDAADLGYISLKQVFFFLNK